MQRTEGTGARFEANTFRWNPSVDNANPIEDFRATFNFSGESRPWSSRLLLFMRIESQLLGGVKDDPATRPIRGSVARSVLLSCILFATIPEDNGVWSLMDFDYRFRGPGNMETPGNERGAGIGNKLYNLVKQRLRTDRSNDAFLNGSMKRYRISWRDF